MTYLCIPQPAPSKPISVALCELAVVAGAAGQSVTLGFDGFPAPVLRQPWKYCTRYAGPSEVHHVRSIGQTEPAFPQAVSSRSGSLAPRQQAER
jgi:hypothetical protein